MADYRLTQSGDEVQEILNNSTPQADLNAETERATGAEHQLQNNINTVQQNLNGEARTREQDDNALRLFIQQVQGSLINYYLKTETYSATEIDTMLAAIKQFRYQVVDQLPTPSAETMGIIYLVPSAHAVSGNIKDEYITLTRDEGSGIIYYFEQIGETAIDLSNYYTKAQTNAEISAAINTAVANYYTKQEVDALIANFITRTVSDLTNYYLKSETYTQAEIQQLIAAIKQFRYQSVAELPTASADTMNKIYLVPSTNPQTKNVKDEFITIATTDQGTTTYSWEQIGSTEIDLSGYYTSAQTDAAINTALSAYSTTTQMNAAIATAIANFYTKQEVDALIANFITRTVSDLANYYLKSETYTQAEIQQLIAAIKQFRYQSVAELPTASADTMNKIYLVPSTNPQTKNVKDEFITIATTDQGTTTYSWEQIGSTEIDLSGYYTSAQTDAAIASALASYSTTEQMSAAIVQALLSYYTKQQVDALIANFITSSVDNLVNYYLKSETFTKSEVNALIAAVQQFTYQSVAELPTASAETMNKIYLVPSTNPATRNVKDEFITISVTDQGTTTYSWEQIGSTTIDLSGYYTSAQTDAAINTALSAYSTTTQMNAAIAAAIANFYTKQEVDALIANFITPSTQNLVYYYMKSETFTKTEVNQLIDAVKQFQYQSVSVLPTASASTMNIIYLVPGQSPTSQNVKDEYITIATTNEMQETVYAWEKIGTTEIDLSNYYTKSQTDAAITAAINTALADYSTTTQMTAAIAAALASYYTKTEVDALIANFITASTQNLAYYYLKTETYSATEVNQLIAAVKQFTYEAVSVLPTASASTVGKIYLVPSANPSTQNVKDEYITLTVTEEETTTYSWEKIGTTQVDLSNYYTKSQTDSAISTAINTALADYSTTSQVSVLISTAVAAALGNFYNKSQVDALIADFITKSVNDLTYYYLKSETYTQSEVQQLIAAVKQFRYQTAATLPTATAQTMGIIYLIPSTNPATQNVKDEFITVESTNDQDETVYAWEQIGSTTVDLSGYYTSSQTDTAISNALTAALADYSTTTQMGDAITLALADYYTKTQVDNLLASAGGHPYYATCSTAGGTAAKVVSITGFTLKEGAEVSILFTNGFTATSPTLNINDGGAKAIKMQGMALSPWMVGNNNIVTMLYNGTDWDVTNIQDRTQGSDSDDFVDLGLPSGTKWAKANLGGTNPQDLGQYFSWGNITGHAKDSGYDFSQTTYNGTTGAGLMGGLSTSSSYDAARSIKGYPWRIPTYDDFLELLSYCRAQWTTVSGQAGMRFTSNINGNSIFLPAAGFYNGTTLQNLGTYGYYWAATLNNATSACNLYFYSTNAVMNSYARYGGMPVRAVQ